MNLVRRIHTRDVDSREFDATVEVRVRRSRHARVPGVRARLSGGLLVDGALETMRVVGGHAGAETQLHS